MSYTKIINPLLFACLLLTQCSGPQRSASPIPSSDSSDSKEQLRRIKMSDLDGKPLELAAFAGKPIFLNFWATWCGPCVSEMKSIEKASLQFKDKISFLALSNEDPSLIKSYVKKNKYSFQFAHLDVTYLDVFVTGLPTTLLIDSKGEIVSVEQGFRDWADPGSIDQLKALK